MPRTKAVTNRWLNAYKPYVKIIEYQIDPLSIVKLELFYAPKLVGGDGRAMIGPLGIGKMAQALALRRLDVRRSGEDLWLSGNFLGWR